MAQTWERLMFAHWRLPAEMLRRVMPAEIPVDTFEGSAWVGVTPFAVSSARMRLMPHLPGLTSFPEVNVRTYATVGGRPGIYFLSLDAASRAAVAAARRTYRLPYFRARMSVSRDAPEVAFSSERVSRDGPAASLDVRYRPVGAARPAEPGSLEYFLTERYCLYTLDAQRRVRRADIHHPPWPLQRAEAEWRDNSMTAGLGLEPADEDAVLHYAARQDVLIWPLGAL
jgi:uncharacterized protein YqjF (DUF2071 family)